MRRPTDDQYEWHTRALAGENPQVTHEPQPGWYLLKKTPVEDGKRLTPFMTPGSIWLEQPIDEETGELLGDEVLLAECGGVPCDPNEIWLSFAKRAICREEYDRRMAELITGETAPLPF